MRNTLSVNCSLPTEDIARNVTVPINWINTSASGNHTLCSSRISHHESGSSSAFVDCSLVVRNDTTWHVHVRGHPLPPSSLILADFGSHLDSVTASMLLARLSDLHTCPGNPEPKFVYRTTKLWACIRANRSKLLHSP